MLPKAPDVREKVMVPPVLASAEWRRKRMERSAANAAPVLYFIAIFMAAAG
jgi:hypothetical protein